MTRKLFLILPLLGLLAVVTSVRSQSPATPRKIEVEDALVTAIEEVKVPATETGMLKKILVKEGHSVDLDALLIEIDNRETIARQRVAKSEYDAAQAQAQNQAELEVAQKAEEVSKAEYDTFGEVKKRNPGAVSDSELRKYLFQYEKAIAQVKQAINEREIAALTAASKLAQLEALSVELDLRQIRSPFNGQVVEVYKKHGEWVQAGEAVMHLIGLDKVRVSGFVLARSASPAEVVGKPCTITVHAAGEKKHTVKGTVGFASPVIEGVGATHQFRIWAEVDNEKSTDPVTGQEFWKIQPGTMASMTVDLTPPAKSTPGKSVSVTKSGKVEALKPVVPGAKTEPVSTSKER